MKMLIQLLSSEYQEILQKVLTNWAVIVILTFGENHPLDVSDRYYPREGDVCSDEVKLILLVQNGLRRAFHLVVPLIVP